MKKSVFNPGSLIIYMFLLIGFFAIVSCSKTNSDDPTNESCPTKAIESESQYNSQTDEPFIIDTAFIDDQCLFVNIEHGGGCEDLTYILVDRGDVAESYPVQRWIKLLIEGTDPCDAIVKQNLSFDLTPIQASGEDISTLHLEGWDAPLVHEYP